MVFNVPQRNAYVGLGSNLGDRAGNLLAGIRGILDAGLEVSRLSQVYETEPVETFPQPNFLNMVAELQLGSPRPPVADQLVALPAPEELMQRLLQIERALGRRRNEAKGPRIIDLDLLLYDNETCDTQLLTLPHPRLHLRRFALVPLAELCPNLQHPTLHRSMNELLQETADRSEVKLWLAGDHRVDMPA